MYHQLSNVAFWRGMYHDLVRWCRECQVCFLVNNKRRNIPHLKPVVTVKPFKIVGIDLMEMASNTCGNHYIVTIVDHFTKYLGAYPIPGKKAETVAEVLFSNWICGCGRWPAALLSVVRASLRTPLWKHYVQLWVLSKSSLQGYCPRENGIMEKANVAIVKSLRKKTVIPAEWDKILTTIAYAYNAAPHQATEKSSFFALWLRSYVPISRWTICEFVARDYITEHTNEYRDRMKRAYDEEWNTRRSAKFSVGDGVYVQIHAEKSSDTPVRGLTTRCGNVACLRKKHQQLIKLPPKRVFSIHYSIFSTTFSSTSDVCTDDVDWHCLGKLMCQGLEV
ncbi:integrase core domain protein [Ostertagia ostertagi]